MPFLQKQQSPRSCSFEGVGGQVKPLSGASASPPPHAGGPPKPRRRAWRAPLQRPRAPRRCRQRRRRRLRGAHPHLALPLCPAPRASRCRSPPGFHFLPFATGHRLFAAGVLRTWIPTNIQVLHRCKNSSTLAPGTPPPPSAPRPRRRVRKHMTHIRAGTGCLLPSRSNTFQIHC